MERIKKDPESPRRPARFRRHGDCVRAGKRRGERIEGGSAAPNAAARRERRIERMIDRKIAEKIRSRRRQRGDRLDIGHLQREVERRGGTLRIVIEFPGQRSAPRPRPSRRHPKFV